MKKKEAVLIACLIIMGCTARVLPLPKRTLWFDEAFTMAMRELSVPEMLVATAYDVHPPLYYLLVKGLTDYLATETGLRLLSVIFSAGTICISLLLISSFPERKTGILSVALVSLSVMQILYATEIRMYAFLTFLFMWALYSLLRFVVATRHRDLASHLLAAALLIYTHYIAVFYLAAFLLAGILLTRQIARRRLVVSYVLIVIIFLPWSGVLWQRASVTFQGGQESLNFLSAYSITSLPTKIFNFLCWGFGTDDAALLITLIWTGLLAFQSRYVRSQPLAVYLLVVIAVPVLLLAVVSLKHNVFIMRALLPLTVPLYMLFAILLMALRCRWLRNVLIAVVILICLWQNIKLITLKPFPRRYLCVKELFVPLRQTAQNHQLPIICSNQEIYLVLRYYLGGDQLRLGGKTNLHPEVADALRLTYPRPTDLMRAHLRIDEWQEKYIAIRYVSPPLAKPLGPAAAVDRSR